MSYDVDGASSSCCDLGDGLENPRRALSNGARRQRDDLADDRALAHPLERARDRLRDAAEVSELAEFAESEEARDEQDVMLRDRRIGGRIARGGIGHFVPGSANV